MTRTTAKWAPAAAPRAASGSRLQAIGAQGRRGSVLGWLFVSPSVIGFAVFILLPLAMTVYYSCTNYDLLTPPTFAGASNYSQLLHDPALRQVYLNTAEFTVLAVPLNVGLGLALALAVNRKMPRWLSVAVRSAFFTPTLVGLVFIAEVWQFFYQTQGGVFNYYLGLVGIGPIPWLSGSHWALLSIVFLDVWKNVGLAMLILLAGLQGIPPSYNEAASIDGASAWRRFWSITRPMLSRQLFFVSTLYLIGALKVFDSIMVLTQGGPANDTRSIVEYIYETAFVSFRFGYASAVSVSLMALIMIVTGIQFLLGRMWVHDV
jgi:multiple sugar transport system permease protein